MEVIIKRLPDIITILAIVIATLTIWKQYWISLYKIYDEDNRKPYLKFDNKYWFVSLVSSLLSWAILTGVIGIIFFMVVILLETTSNCLIATGFGLSVYSLLILLITVLVSACPTWIKAKNNQRWGTYKFARTQKQGNNQIYQKLVLVKTNIYSLVACFIFGTRDYKMLFSTNNKVEIKRAVNHAGIFSWLCLINLLIISCILFCAQGGLEWLYLLIPNGIGILIMLLYNYQFKKAKFV